MLQVLHGKLFMPIWHCISLIDNEPVQITGTTILWRISQEYRNTAPTSGKLLRIDCGTIGPLCYLPLIEYFGGTVNLIYDS